ncbi:hypothetical protein [Kitasatospora cathayae]|uniref:Uncharacterized protein n=1 Tax=Kitasatospora cathayae TaxID=3004092 RepID=A0ABY7QE58_9ACTN|nr:hypothetical protein [Kitasatospora sp. HUAS 3-15]WBP91006.1 hypothetical protein O1G21_37495 [Kitasatospora sp. HUAS 3-15]
MWLFSSRTGRLLRGPAAQQLLRAWVPDAKYSGEVATASELRREFGPDLEGLGNLPRRPRKLGVSNGRGDGVGHPLPAGEVAFDTENTDHGHVSGALADWILKRL